MIYPKEIKEKILKMVKVDNITGCWNYNGLKIYGIIYVNGKRQRYKQ